jgi:hypothetical protein
MPAVFDHVDPAELRAECAERLEQAVLAAGHDQERPRFPRIAVRHTSPLPGGSAGHEIQCDAGVIIR